MGEWRPSTWGHEVTLNYGKAIRGYQTATRGFRVYGSNGPVGWHNEPLADGPGVILGRKGAYRGVQYSPDPFFVIDTAYYVTPKGEMNMRWLYYAIKYHRLGEIDDGSPIPSTTRSAVYTRDFDVPLLGEQKDIANVLSSLDDKIELNRRMNATLEGMAQAIFRDWFVDFGPVRRKMAGATDPVAILGGLISNPARAAELAALFPDTLVDDGLPVGWEMGRVADIGKVVCGKTPSTIVKEYYGDGIPFITIPEMHGKIFALDIARQLSKLGAKSQANKMLPKGSICVSCIATPGLVVITSEPSQTNQQINSVLPNQANEVYYWYWILRRLGSEIRSGGSGGSVLANLSTGRFIELQVLRASESTRKQFNLTVKPLFDKLAANEAENRTLAETRDYLLPRLMSGKVRVTDAERIVA